MAKATSGALRRTMAAIWPLAPAPATLSDAGQALWRQGLPMPEADAPDLAAQRLICDDLQTSLGVALCQRFDVRIENTEIAGIPVRVFHPEKERRDDRLLINCHGGGFMKDSGSITENVPIAGLTGVRVVAIRYRLAPEYRFPAAVDDVEIVYRALTDRHPASAISLYGTSAGATLCAQSLVRFRDAGLPMPARLGFFSGTADLSRPTDSDYFFPLADAPDWIDEIPASYLDDRTAALADVSPLLGNVDDFPPTLCIASTRDLMLSPTALFQRALLRAGVDAQLVVFEALPHAFWSYLDLPESAEAFALMARFLGGDERR